MKSESTQPPAREAVGMVRLAVPLALGHLGTHLMGVVDVAVVGRHSGEALAAVGLGNGVFFGIFVLGMGVMFALDPLVSQAVGAGRHRDADNLFWQGLWLALLLTAPISGIVLAAMSALHWTPIETSVVEQANAYVAARVLSVFPLFAFLGVRSYLQSYDVTRPFVIAVVVANLLNLPLNIALVFGDDGLEQLGLPPLGVPALGVVGAGWATVVAAVVQCAVMMGSARLRRPSIASASRRLSALELHRALRIGLPIALTIFAEVAFFSITGVLAGWLGANALAAHNVALTLAGTTFQVVIAIGTAASVRVGQAIGADQTARARSVGFIALAMGTAWMSLGALVFVLFSRPLVELMTDEPEVINTAVPLMIAAAAFQLVDGAQGVMNGALRGAGDTRFAFYASVVSHYVLGMPFALLAAFVWKWGTLGLWWGLCIGLAAVAAALIVRFWRLSSTSIAQL